MRNRNTIEFLATWEKLYNPNFNRVQFEAVMEEAGLNRFVMTPQKWANTTNAIGIRSTPGRYGGTFAHKDIAFEFASWVSPEFKLYIIKDYQRLKEDENSRLSLNWNVRRALSKVNYKIHTDAVKKHLIPDEIPAKYKGYTYASEADILNVALFGMTAKEWREANPDKKGNIRDEATIEELVVLINLEGLSAELIKNGLSSEDRLKILHETAQAQMQSILDSPSMKALKQADVKKLLT